ncbi:unnamed protein product, partial [Ostreobium quekettii]
ETKEALNRLHKMGQFESMSFDPLGNDVERAVQVGREHWDYILEEGWRWALSAVIGITMGTLAFLIDFGIESLNTWKFNTTLDALEKHGGFWWPYCTFVGIAVIYATIAGGLVSYVEPLAAGSGIPEIKTYLNGVHIKGLLRLRTLIAKLGSVMFSISGGLVAGKEGPFVHGGGVVGGGLGSMGSKHLTDITKKKIDIRMSRKFGGYFRNHADHRDFVAIGTAAGVSTAFAAPIGGLLFTIEEGASFYSLATVLWRGFLATCTGIATLRFLAEVRADAGVAMWSSQLGTKRDFGLYSDGYANYGRNLYYFLWELPLYLLLGGMGGVLGALFIAINVHITRLRQKFIPVRAPNRRLVEVMFVAAVTSSIAFCLCYISPCRELPAETDRVFLKPRDDNDQERFYQGGGQLDYFPRLWCPKDHYSLWGQFFFTPLTEALRLVFHMGEPFPDAHPQWEFESSSLFILFAYTFGLMTWTYGVGAATGLFVPSLTVGATSGRLVGRLVKITLDRLGVSKVRVSLGSYAIIGAAASLGGATRMTISIVVLVMETTGALELLVPIMMAAWVAKMVGDSLGMGIYDTHIELRGVPLLNEDSQDYDSRMVHDELAVSELMSSEMVLVPPVIRVGDIVSTLTKFPHGGFPVSKMATDPIGPVSSPVPVDGVITRSLLLRLLQRRVGLVRKGPDSAPEGDFLVPTDRKEVLELHASIEPYPMRICPRTDQAAILRNITEDDMEDFIDLRPFMQRHPFFVHADSSLTRAHRLFRTMGLRHLFVVPPAPMVVGMLTRKDIIRENAIVALEEKANLEIRRKHKIRIRQKISRRGVKKMLRFMPETCTAEGTGTAVKGADDDYIASIARHRAGSFELVDGSAEALAIRQMVQEVEAEQSGESRDGSGSN